MPVKLQILEAYIYILVYFVTSVLTDFNEMLCLFKHRWICHRSSPQFQDVVNVLVGRRGCSLKIGISTMAMNLPSTFKPTNIQASRFSLL